MAHSSRPPGHCPPLPLHCPTSLFLAQRHRPAHAASVVTDDRHWWVVGAGQSSADRVVEERVSEDIVWTPTGTGAAPSRSAERCGRTELAGSRHRGAGTDLSCQLQEACRTWTRRVWH